MVFSNEFDLQDSADSPRDLMEGAEALAFFGVLALGFRTSRFERFWPLAIQFPDAESDRPSRGERALAQPQGILPGKGCKQAIV